MTNLLDRRPGRVGAVETGAKEKSTRKGTEQGRKIKKAENKREKGTNQRKHKFKYIYKSVGVS